LPERRVTCHGKNMKNRLQSLFWMACVLFLIVPNLYSQSSRVFYVSWPDYHVRELFYSNALLNRWLGNDLTADTNGPPPNFNLTTFFDGSSLHFGAGSAQC
jgi:hypothetical protein